MADVNDWHGVKEVTERERRYRRIVEVASEGIWEIDAQSRTTFVSDRMAEMLGYSVSEMAGVSLFEFMDEEGNAIAAEDVRRRQAGIKERHDFKFRRKDGSDLWAIVSADPIFDSAGAYAGSLGVITDVTDRKQAETALHSLVLGLASVGVTFFPALVRELATVLNVRHAFVARLLSGLPERACTIAVWANGQVADNFEYELADTPCASVAGQTLCYIPAGVQEQFPRDRLLSDLAAQAYLGVPLFASSGRALGLLVVLHDKPLPLPKIAHDLLRLFGGRAAAELERHEADEAVRTLSSAIDQTEESILVTDVAGVIEDVNSGLEQMTGYTAGEVRGLTPRVFKSDRHTPAFYQDLWKTLLDGRPFRAEFTNRRKDGALYQEEKTIRPIRNDQGAITHFVSVGRDITERKRAETRMRRFSYEIIAAREAERKQASSILHHDLGSLVVGISAHFDAVEKDLGSGNTADALKWMKRTRKLFDESVGHLKRVAVQLRPPELDALGLRAALRQHFSQVTAHGSTRVHFRETLGRRRVSGDTATALFRVAQEALTNAITHGHAKRVDVSITASKQKISMTVRDDGQGFDLLEQRPARSHMGLRVMKEMMVSAGGAFTIDSGPRKGTTVRVSLPLAIAAPEQGDLPGKGSGA
jgi:PAS domain S-box-containing protein